MALGVDHRGGGMVKRLGLGLALGISASVVAAEPVLAHAEYRDSQPVEDATIGRPPDEVSISFTEPPAGDAQTEVRDGCGDDVSGEAIARGQDLIVAIEKGEPGEWMVGYSVVSLVDGHSTRGDFSFTVRGTADCESAAGAPAGEEPSAGRSATSAQLILVAVTSALVAVTTMLLVATVRRVRTRHDLD